MLNLRWHKWKYVYTVHTKLFLGSECPYLRKDFRVCIKCKRAQEFCGLPDYWSWRDLSECETRVLWSKVIDKGDYFVLE